MPATARTLEPNWYPFTALYPQLRRSAFHDWVLEAKSMTNRLRRFSQHTLRINVIKHQWNIPRLSERHLLRLKPGQATIIREIQLIGQEQALIYARSVYPDFTLTGKTHVLRHLAKRPVGDVMASDPLLFRSSLELAKIRRGHTDFTQATINLTKPPAYLWGRRMLFYIYNKPILVSEFFLPPLLAPMEQR